MIMKSWSFAIKFERQITSKSLTIKIGLTFWRSINRLCLYNLCDILLGHTSSFLKMIVLHNLLVCVLYNSHSLIYTNVRRVTAYFINFWSFHPKNQYLRNHLHMNYKFLRMSTLRHLDIWVVEDCAHIKKIISVTLVADGANLMSSVSYISQLHWEFIFF